MTKLSDAAVARLRALDATPHPEGDRYAILDELGRGGMGVVYRAHDRRLGRDVALKVVGDHQTRRDPSQRLAREAHALARLEHPGIVPVHDVGSLVDGRLYYVMKLVRGQRLDQRLASGVSLGEGLRIFGRICDAVAFAHSRFVIHRDLKPQNVMLGDFGDVLVLDWGVAKLRDAGDDGTGVTTSPRRGVTGDGAVIGTPGYMAPEQATGATRTVDERADIFALGIILQDIVANASERERPRVLQSIVQRATAPEADDRYRSVSAFAADVAAWVDGLPVSAHRESILERIARVAGRHRVALALIGVYVVVRLLMLWLLNPSA